MRKTLLAGIALITIAGAITDASASPITFSYSGSIVDYTIPTTGLYDITAAGAQGGNGQKANVYCLNFIFKNCVITTTPGGLGAVISGEYLLAAGDELKILAGGSGRDGKEFYPYDPNFEAGGGGGGSFVALVSRLSTIPVPLVVAGGGGGSDGLDPGGGGLTTQDGGGPYGGTNGNGGGYDINRVLISASSGGGGGYYTNGASPYPNGGGASFLNGGGGGAGGYSGGFGGGGAGSSNDLGSGSGGGGGGYSGGSDGNFSTGSGYGGGSYLDPLALDPVLTAAANSGDGYVTIDPVDPDPVPEPGSLALFAPALLGLLALRRRGRA